MYMAFGMILLFGMLFFCILTILIFHFRKANMIKKLNTMTEEDKEQLLASLTRPCGFSYRKKQDIFTSTHDAWQRSFGYQSVFDQTAALGQIVFQCEPIYFNYRGRTWLIELWKGQYGITTGGEIGIYHADTLLEPEDYSSTPFEAASDEEMLMLRMELWRGKWKIFRISDCHWWLTGFRLGIFSHPEELRMKCALTFPDADMMDAFLDALLALGYGQCELDLWMRTVSFTFLAPKSPQPCQDHRIRCGFAQWKNRLFCRIYRHLTRCFDLTTDKLLCFYYCLPKSFQRTIFLNRRNYFECQPTTRQDI